MTLGFCGDKEINAIRLIPYTNLIIEALSDCFLDVQYIQNCSVDHDLILKWLIDLHLVRHPVSSEARLILFFKLLINKFGIRRCDGYLLPLIIGHARIGEVIGTTRSTVTRQISLLKQQKFLISLEPQGQFLFSEKIIEDNYGQ